MQILVLLMAAINLAAVAWATRFHFRSLAPPRAFLAMGAAWAIDFAVFAYEMLGDPMPMWRLGVAAVAIAVSLALFFWAVRASSGARLKLIYDEDRPRRILKDGPYRFIRHPFYASYVLFFAGLAIATTDLFNIAFAVVMVPILMHAAREEERGFERSRIAEQYAAYRREAGMFLPRLRRG